MARFVIETAKGEGLTNIRKSLLIVNAVATARHATNTSCCSPVDKYLPAAAN